MSRLLAFLLSVWLAVTPALAAVGTIYVDTGGAATNSGTTDANSPVISGTGANWTTATTTINLDTNTNIGSVPGCSAGTCDGSQAIFLTNATNANSQHIFWITAYSGCTGTGACSVTTSVAVTCVTCTAQVWSIGGRYLFPSAATSEVVVAALRAGDTLQFNNSPATKTGTYITSRSSGDSTTGFITIQGKAGVLPLLNEVSGTNTAFTINSNNGWYIKNLEFQQNGTVGNCITVSAAQNVVLDSVKISKCPAAGLSAGANNEIKVINSEITGAATSGIAAAGNLFLVGSYIHGNTGDGLTISVINPISTLSRNIIASNGGRGINFSGASATPSSGTDVSENTVYSNTTAGLEVANANTSLTLRNNIFVNDGTHANVIWDAGTAELIGYHAYNTFYASGGTNVTGLTPNSTESTANPLLNNPGTGDFTLQKGSPAIGTGFPGVMIGGPTGHASMGALSPSSSSGAPPCPGC